MTAATAAAVDAGHKVRGGSALSLALARASPALPPGYTTSPADSPGPPASLPASCGAGWLSSSLGSTQPASPPVGSCSLPAPTPTSQQQGAQPPHGGAQVVQQQQRVSSEPASQPHAAHSRSRLLPFLGACFGGGSQPHSDSSVRPQPAVSASEVGIRPCFYWLHEDGPGGNNEAERMCAEANARWLKSDCQVRARERCRSGACHVVSAFGASLRLVVRMRLPRVTCTCRFPAPCCCAGRCGGD